ncbi:MAG: ABC transporter permease [Thaumarchaeota archaeon]|nr:ABC transporter permease [Nitrososphaerota archaeon]
MSVRTILLNRWIIRLCSVVVFLIVWQLVGESISPLSFSPPTVVLVVFGQNWANGILPSATLITLQTVFVGFMISMLVGIPLGLIIGRSRNTEYALDPYINLIYSTPVVAIIPLVAIWFGSNFLSSYLVVLITALFPIMINTITGVKDVNKSLLETGRSFGFSGLKLWRKVVLPSATPYIMTGLRLGIGASIIGALLAELFMYDVGLGYVLVNYESRFDTPVVICGVLIIMALGIGLTEVVKFAEKKISPWAIHATGVS